jgi:hypothetical protein
MGPSIRVIGENPWDKMDPMSRVNFLKIYTVEHHVEVHRFGVVDPQHEWKLVSQFGSHWNIPTFEHPPADIRPSEDSTSTYGHSQIWEQQMPPILEHRKVG